MNEDFLRIPKARVRALIGVGGRTKKELEKKSGSTIEASREGDVTVFGEDPLSVFNLKNVIKAIGRGFSAKDAYRLFSGDETLSIININEIAGEREKTIVRMKSRIIGSGGRSKEHIEYVTNTRIAVYGKTISIIGKHDDVADAEGAINMLLGGATHKSAFGAIQRKKVLRE